MSSAAEGLRHLLVGAEVPVARRLNDLARDGVEGCDTRPLRRAQAFLEGDGPPLGERAFLSSLRLLGPAFDGRRLFPEAAAQVAGKLASFDTPPHLILCIAPLTDLLLAENSADAKAFRATSWDRIYELTWVDVVTDLRRALPDYPLTVVTPRGAALQSAALLTRLFGNGITDPRHLLRAALNTRGQDALAEAEASGAIGDIPGIYAKHVERPDSEAAEALFGLDDVTFDLLQDRFREDVLRVAGMDDAVVI